MGCRENMFFCCCAFVACAVIAENTIPLSLFTGHYLVKAVVVARQRVYTPQHMTNNYADNAGEYLKKKNVFPCSDNI
jgi:hypothetical protein